jgi:hypothetical protein
VSSPALDTTAQRRRRGGETGGSPTGTTSSTGAECQSRLLHALTGKLFGRRRIGEPPAGDLLITNAPGLFDEGHRRRRRHDRAAPDRPLGSRRWSARWQRRFNSRKRCSRALRGRAKKRALPFLSMRRPSREGAGRLTSAGGMTVAPLASGEEVR